MPEQESQPYGVEPPPIRPPHIWPVPVFAPEILPETAPEKAVCLQCGYSIRGLPTAHNCPECGTPIARSLRGNLLEFSSTDYVQSLHTGVTVILIAVIAQIAVICLVVAAMAVFGVFAGRRGSSPPDLQLWMSIAMLPVTAAQLLGWWLFSAPDPAILGTEKGQSPRNIIRISVAVTAGAAVLDLLVRAMATRRPEVAMLAMLAGTVTTVASIVQFFASMLYLRWLAPRLPDRSLEEQAKRNIWMLPLIYVVGFCILFIGPLVAMVIYLLMLNRFRIRLWDIRLRQPSNPQHGIALRRRLY